MKRLLIFGILLSFCFSATATAQELYQEIQGVWRGKVVQVIDEWTEVYPPGDVEAVIQTLEVELLDGDRVGELVQFDNDYIQLEKGDAIYLNYLVLIDGSELFSVREKDRRLGIFVLIALFAAVLFAFGGKQGLRSLVSLTGSLLVIVFILVPVLLSGFPPVLASVGIAGLILFFAIFFTHGFNQRSLIAYGGTLLAVICTGVLAYISIHMIDLTGFSSDESIYLNLNTGGQLDFVGLLLAAIIIGALGVLDDVAITQVAVVRELYSMNKKVTKWEVWKRAMRVGKEHVGALVNTLFLAYVGTALPLLLLFSLSESGTLSIINREVFATEIVRSIVGSLGLILTVPITTFLAAHFLYKLRGIEEEDEHVQVCCGH